LQACSPSQWLARLDVWFFGWIGRRCLEQIICILTHVSRACKFGKASSPGAVIVPIAAPIARLDQGQEPKYPAIERVKEAFA